jgi:protoporphyrin/coproporphyrin ferrochelatase
MSELSELSELPERERSIGLMLINLGTPDSPEPGDVRRYLAEFLMDPYVIDVPFLSRWLLVYGAILPFRPKKSSSAYQKIWSKDRGSPLRYHMEDFTQKLQIALNQRRGSIRFVVKMAMRYGNPSIESVMEQFIGSNRIVDELVVLPLYPQYSLAATHSSIEACQRTFQSHKFSHPYSHSSPYPYPYPYLRFVESFHNADFFIRPLAKSILRDFDLTQYDHVLFSFHGLPERQVVKAELSCVGCVEKSGESSTVTGRPCAVPAKPKCYRAQCFETAYLLAKATGLTESQYTVCFQSRLGRTPWLKPFTDQVVSMLPTQGVKRVLVVCPSFTMDCLETLEEIGIRAREDFVRVGGDQLDLAPCLNAQDHWVEACADFAISISTTASTSTSTAIPMLGA